MPAAKSKPHENPSPQAFYFTRRAACLTQEQAADMLHVNIRTIKNWESGRSQIPYSALKLLRILGRHELPGAQWEDWFIQSGVLYSPGGRRFEVHELLYVANYFAMARFWIKEREIARELRPKISPVVRPVLRLVAGGIR